VHADLYIRGLVMTPPAVRVAKSRSLRAAAGERRIEVVLSREAALALHNICRRTQETMTAAICRAVVEAEKRQATWSST
jgi:hypothetical protein